MCECEQYQICKNEQFIWFCSSYCTRCWEWTDFYRRDSCPRVISLPWMCTNTFGAAAEAPKPAFPNDASYWHSTSARQKASAPTRRSVGLKFPSTLTLCLHCKCKSLLCKTVTEYNSSSTSCINSTYSIFKAGVQQCFKSCPEDYKSFTKASSRKPCRLVVWQAPLRLVAFLLIGHPISLSHWPKHPIKPANIWL